jgi:hypothetical protein
MSADRGELRVLAVACRGADRDECGAFEEVE